MGICGYYGPFDFGNACIRESWSALLPAAFVFGLCVSYIPIPHLARQFIRNIRSPFEPFITLHEAEALGIDSDQKERTVDEEEDVASGLPHLVPLWRTLLVTFIGIVECFCWTADGAYKTYNEGFLVWHGILPFFVAVAWLYAIIRPVIRPTPTPPYDLFTLYLMFLVASIIRMGGFIFDYAVSDIPLPPPIIFTTQVINMVAVLVLLVVTVRMPLAIPSNIVEIEKLVSGTKICYHLMLNSDCI